MKIVVFASYKGGVGRTYATVSVANVFARYGRNVLLVDMDVDAPSLPLLYDLPVWEELGASPKGVVPWLANHAGDLAANIIDLGRNPAGGRLRLLPAGPVGDDYLDSLLSDEWRDGIELDAQGFSIRLRAAFDSLDDPPEVVLIDSRAGLVPTSGGLVYYLADSVVFVFAGDAESVPSANRMTENLGDAMLPVLSRFPRFLDPELAGIGKNLASLTARDRLQFLHAAPGHEGSAVPTIGLQTLDATSPLTLDHFRLARHLDAGLELPPPSADHDLTGVWKRAQRTVPIDYKLFRIISRGHLVNTADASRNVAFRVDTIASILKHATGAIPDEIRALQLHSAGETAGAAFGADLADDLKEVDDDLQRLVVWCDFDAATGFGNMAPERSVAGGISVRVEDAFLNKTNEGGDLLEGYVGGVIRKLLHDDTLSLRHNWTKGGTTLITSIDPRDENG